MAVDPLAWTCRSHGLSWRIARPEDMAALERVHHETGRWLNPDPLPSLLKPPVLLTLVAEDGTGEIVYGAYVEAVAYIRAIGVHKRGTPSLIGIASIFRSFLRGAGFRMAKTSYRKQMTGLVRPVLEAAGFVAEDKQGPVFHYDLRE